MSTSIWNDNSGIGGCELICSVRRKLKFQQVRSLSSLSFSSLHHPSMECCCPFNWSLCDETWTYFTQVSQPVVTNSKNKKKNHIFFRSPEIKKIKVGVVSLVSLSYSSVVVTKHLHFQPSVKSHVILVIRMEKWSFWSIGPKKNGFLNRHLLNFRQDLSNIKLIRSVERVV